eukprot:TRINITY_DN1924_c0_g1_i5.p1 TRINITY_DN1924_c0_g1~~TRINITY_DN1924_c0_g1_i5.p1  ORF type:complete len:201 (-),score=35.24 TRINITY_DN1924_c0_g1_i5:73-675(-)
MGGTCSRKRDEQDAAEDLQRGGSGRSSRNFSFRWPVNPFVRLPSDVGKTTGKAPSLLELSIQKICENFFRYKSFALLPRDLSQQIFNELLRERVLTRSSLQAFRDCALQDVSLGGYPGVDDSWIEVLASQGLSLLDVDISDSTVTDSGLFLLHECTNLQSLNLNYCNYISNDGMKYLSGSSFFQHSYICKQLETTVLLIF